jgi:hypothetical protein
VNGATLAVMAKRSYRRTVQGELSDNLQPAFPGMQLTRSEGNTPLNRPRTRPAEPKVSYAAGAMLAVAAFGPVPGGLVRAWLYGGVGRRGWLVH